MKIEVYKCRFTGKIFQLEQKEKYVKHLLSLRKEMSEMRLREKNLADIDAWLTAEKENVQNVEDIPAWILANQAKLMKSYNIVIKGSSFHDMFKAGDKFDRITFPTGMRYDSHVSNSHSCPKGGVQNWCGRNKDDPTGYPGYSGDLSCSLIRKPRNDWEYPAGKFFDWLGIHTGTGGGGNKNQGWDCKVFLGDWPGISRTVLADKLAGVK